MVCKRCGHSLRQNVRFCPHCGLPVETKAEELAKQIDLSTGNTAKEKKWRIAAKILTVALIVVALVLAVAITLFLLKREPKAEEPSEQVEVLLEEINALQARWTDENGYIPEEDLQACLAEVYAVLEEDDTVTFCERNTDCIYFECEDGFGYVYLPELEDYSAGGDTLQIMTAQPFLTENQMEYAFHDHDAPDSVAQQIDDQYDLWSFDNSGGWNDDNMDDAELTVSRLLDLGDYKLILWHGHGGYSNSTGYFAATGIKATEEAQDRYYDYLKNKYALISTKGNLCFAESFFENCYEDDAFDHAVIYMATCHSGETQDFARILLEKGAAAVYVNSTVISRGYNLRMMRAVGESLCRGETVTQALDSAKQQHGDSYNGAYVYCVTPEGYEEITLQRIAQILLPQPAPEDLKPAQPDPDESLPEYVTAYQNLLLQQEPMMGGSDITQFYTLYDIDQDGIPECLIEQGWGDDYRICDVYTAVGTYPVYLGTFHTNYSVLYGEEVGGLTIMSGYGGLETCRIVYIDDGEVQCETLYMDCEVDYYWYEACEMLPLVLYELSDSAGLTWNGNPRYDNWAALAGTFSRIYP